MNHIPVKQFIEEAHDRSVERKFDRRLSVPLRFAVGFVAAGLTIGAGYALGKAAPDGSPSQTNMERVEKCAIPDVKALEREASQTAVDDIISRCAIIEGVTLLPTDYAAAEAAIAQG